MMRIILVALAVVFAPAAWAQPFNQFVAGLPSANPLGGADLLYVVQGGISKNTTAAALASSFPSLSFANPTASIGLVPINGSASTAMRSDAAPAINTAIVPTWSGLHTFAAGLVGAVNGVNVTGTPSIGYIPVATGSATASWTNFLGTANSWTAIQQFGALPWVATGQYAAGSVGANVLSVRGSNASPNTDGVATAIFQSVTNFAGTTPAFYASNVKRSTDPAAYGIGAWAEAFDVVGGGSSSGGRWSSTCNGGTGGNCAGATNVGVCTVSYAFCQGSEEQVWNSSGTDATTTFSAAKFATAVLASCAGTNKCDTAFMLNPNGTVATIYGFLAPSGTIDSTGSVLASLGTSAHGINFNGATCSTDCWLGPSGTSKITGAGDGLLHTLTATAVAPTVAAGQIGYGSTTVAAGSGTCPTGTVGGQTVAGCIVVNIAGTARNVPFF